MKKAKYEDFTKINFVNCYKNIRESLVTKAGPYTTWKINSQNIVAYNNLINLPKFLDIN